MQKKLHHIIPREYLERFCDPAESRKKLWILNKNQNKIYPSTPDNAIKQTDFYLLKRNSREAALEVEDKLNLIETDYPIIFEKFSTRQSLTDSERESMALFIASMMMRTNSKRVNIKGFLQKLRDHAIQLETIHNAPKSNITIQIEESIETIHQEHLIGNILDIYKIIHDMKYVIIEIPESNDDIFLTSDNPCVMINPVGISKYGWGTIGSAPGLLDKDIEITLPISPKMCFFAGWGITGGDGYLENPTQEEINRINLITRAYTDNFLISSDKNLLFEISKELDLDIK